MRACPGGRAQVVEQVVAGLAEQRQQAVVVAGPPTLVKGFNVCIRGQCATDDRAPEPLNPAEVPQKVVGFPVGARRHPHLRGRLAQDLRKACGILGQVG